MSWVEAPESGAKIDSYRVTHVAKWSSVQMGESFDPTLLRGYCVVNESTADEITMVAIAASSTSSETLVTILLTKSCIQIVESILLEGRVLTVTAWSDSSDGALIQLEDGQLMEFESSQSIAPSQAEPLLEPCPWIAALKNVSAFDDGGHGQRTRMVIGRSWRGRLYCQELLLTDAASSFFLSTHHEYLCFATAGSRCQLRFLSLFELHNFDPLLGSDENRVLQGYEPRNIERGARIVIVLPEKPVVVVQMPRGNLELVHPRALVLRHSVRMIDNGEYAKAFALLRRHRVDLNLIVDLDPVQFLDGGRAELFVEEVERIDHMNLFISSLQNGDASVVVPKWWYGGARNSDRPGSGEFDSATKVNRSCEVFRSIMMKAETNSKTLGGRPIAEGHFLLPILSTFAKQSPPKLEEALRMIKQDAIAKHPNAASPKTALFSDSAQSSIQYLAFLAEYELLFETALGMYDFDVARAVARNSQMDPKAYLPLLKRYRELPENFARFEVDVRLKRFESALRHLHRSHQDGEVVESGLSPSENGSKPNDFNACARLVEEHGIFHLGLELFEDDAQKLQILLSLGDFLLREKNDPTAALSVYLSCSPNVDYERAIHAARQCHDWKTFFSLTASRVEGASPSDTAGSLIAREVADELVTASSSKANRRQLLSDAARVLLDYGSEHDVAMAVDILLKGESWMEARRNAQRHGRDDLVRKCIEAAVQYANATLSDLVERSESFVSTLELYSASLRLRKESSKGNDFGNDDYPDAGDDSGSLFSLASNASDMSKASGISTGSSYSVTSSVISVKTTTTFTVTGNEERNRHKSKFNSAGDRKSKPRKKRGRKGRSKALPGSDQELQGLLQALRSTCVDASYRDVIADTLTFLLRNGRMSLAIELFVGYNDFAESMDKAQIERRAREEEERVAAETKSRKEGMTGLPPPVLDVEREVDALVCAPFPDALQQLFSFLPSSVA
jgi:elongator complex protein 1